MNASVVIAAAYLVLTIQGAGLSGNETKIIPYTSMKQCLGAVESIRKNAIDDTQARCLPGSTDWHDPNANKP
jgi:hypothetical protein